LDHFKYRAFAEEELLEDHLADYMDRFGKLPPCGYGREIGNAGEPGDDGKDELTDIKVLKFKDKEAKI